MKKGPFVLLLILLLVSIFMLGIRYGKKLQSVESTNIPIASPYPPSPKATKTEAFTFTEYIHKGCGISFLRPSQFKATKESSLSAALIYEQQNISIECPKKSIKELEKIEKTTATSSVLLQNKNLQGYREGNNIRFTVEHTYKKTPIIFSVDNNLLPLIQSSLQFIP